MQLVDQLEPKLSTTTRRLLSSSGSSYSSGSFAADHYRVKQQLQEEKDLHLQFCQDFGKACRQQRVRGAHTQEVRGKEPLLLYFRAPTCVVRDAHEDADEEPTVAPAAVLQPPLQHSATGAAACEAAANDVLVDGVAAAAAAAAAAATAAVTVTVMLGLSMVQHQILDQKMLLLQQQQQQQQQRMVMMVQRWIVAQLQKMQMHLLQRHQQQQRQQHRVVRSRPDDAYTLQQL
jgi:hypothetical protein